MNVTFSSLSFELQVMKTCFHLYAPGVCVYVAPPMDVMEVQQDKIVPQRVLGMLANNYAEGLTSMLSIVHF